MKTLDKMTKAELVAMVQAQGKEIVAMREELSTLRHDAALLLQSGTEQEQANAAQRLMRAQLDAVREERDELVRICEESIAQGRMPKSPQAWPTVTEHVRNIPAHFAAAREAAMRLGRVVKVGGAS